MLGNEEMEGGEVLAVECVPVIYKTLSCSSLGAPHVPIDYSTAIFTE